MIWPAVWAGAVVALLIGAGVVLYQLFKDALRSDE